ncbi:hypothetical protein GUR47_38210 [Streptomyces tendae]|uniref:Uncharacterized protein n=1 Tax=Streptomyces tendae TaxID=1932 RepID=A0A6B3QZG7_STRTE|nr:hypothetical protein [Streptomyces tendae]NEV92470.1 hypothetical protein [Streptomyces tendae]
MTKPQSNGRAFRSPITADPGPVYDLIQALRDLCEAAGNPKRATIAKECGVRSLGGLFNGRLESRELTLAVVRYLNGDEEELGSLYDAARDWEARRVRWASEEPLVLNWPRDASNMPKIPEIRENFGGFTTEADQGRGHPVRNQILAIQSEIDQYLKVLLMDLGASPEKDMRSFLRRLAEEVAMPLDRYRFRRLASIIDDFREVTSSLLQDSKVRQPSMFLVFHSYITTAEHFLEAMNSNVRQVLESRARRVQWTEDALRYAESSPSNDSKSNEILEGTVSRHPKKRTEETDAVFDIMLAAYPVLTKAIGEIRAIAEACIHVRADEEGITCDEVTRNLEEEVNTRAKLKKRLSTGKRSDNRVLHYCDVIDSWRPDRKESLLELVENLMYSMADEYRKAERAARLGKSMQSAYLANEVGKNFTPGSSREGKG